MTLPVALGLAMRGNRWLRLVGEVGLLLMAAPLAASMSRTGWIAAIAGCVLAAIMTHRGKVREWRRGLSRRRWRGVAFAFAGTAIVAGGIITAYNLKPDSARGRMLMWRVAAEALLEAPATGVGWDNVAGAYGEAQERYFSRQESWEEAGGREAGSPDYLFNEYLQTGLAFGWPAMVAFIIFIITALYTALKGDAYGAAGGMLAFATVCFASYPLQFNLFIICAAVLALACVTSRWTDNRTAVAAMSLTFMAIGGTVRVIAVNTRRVREAQLAETETARMLYQSGAYREAAEGFAPMERELDWNADYLFEYGHALHKAGRYGESERLMRKALKVTSDPMPLNILGKNLQARKDYSGAAECFRRASLRKPSAIYPHYLLMKLHEEAGNEENMRREAAVLLGMPTKVDSPAEKDMRKEAKELFYGIKNGKSQ